MKSVASKTLLITLGLTASACGQTANTTEDRRITHEQAAAEQANDATSLALTNEAEAKKAELLEKAEELKGELKEILEEEARAYCGIDEEIPLNSEVLVQCGFKKAADDAYPEAHKVAVAGFMSYTAYQYERTTPYGDRRVKIAAGLTNSPEGYEVTYYQGGFQDSGAPLSEDFTLTMAGGVAAFDSAGQVTSTKGIGVLAFHVDGLAMAYLRSGRNPDNNYVCMSVLYVSNACWTETEWRAL